MKGAGRVEFAIGVGLLLMVASGVVTTAFGENVTYDHRALVIDGQRRVLISGSIHYPRSTPDMWPDLIQKAKDGGLDVIETYVFWNLHEPVREQWDFQGNKDLVKFLKLIAEAGLYAHLRIGPYVCAEWNYGGFPVWLHSVPGIKLRTDNDPFKAEMKRFTTKIVDMMKQQNLYAAQGGPIILSQIENEYGNVDKEYGPAAKPYIDWAASMATSLNTEVPWVMCQQANAPDPIINTCNGFYCDNFTPNSNKKPKMWTENWTGWFVPFGGAVPYRPVEDIAFAVARFYQRGGTFQNYYMYHGGTNFGHSAGGMLLNSYDYDAPLDEFGIPNQPKWGHLRDLHIAIKLCQEAMVATDPKITTLAPDVEAAVYETGEVCSAFLANLNNQSQVTANFNGKTYHLPAWSVSILPDCKNVVFNTAQINGMEVLPGFLGGDADPKIISKPTKWSWVNEPVGISIKTAFNKNGLADQVNTTGDRSDYLWYSLSIDIKGDEPFLQDGSRTVLHVDSQGHLIYAFVNGKLAGNGYGSLDKPAVSIEVPITLARGTNKFDLLGATVGLKNYGAFFDLAPTGINRVELKGLNNSTFDLSSKQWTYQIGLKGEELGLHTGSSPLWVSNPAPALPINQTLTWFKTNFDAPAVTIGDHPIALMMRGMGKGEAWINGQSLGRYWPSKIAPEKGCVDFCDYRGNYYAEKCQKYCGEPSQILHHVPRSWLKPKGNVLVLFEEKGGDVNEVSFYIRMAGYMCSNVSEAQPAPIDEWLKDPKTTEPTLSLECPFPNQIISDIDFVSYGNPTGKCGSLNHGTCSSPVAKSVVEKACLNKASCSVIVSDNTFGDPCPGVTKHLAVQASCSDK